MKKILILGSCGAGKSLFAKRLHNLLGLKLIHLDQYYWKPNWERTDSLEFRKKVKELIADDEWIMDGNYRSTLDIRMPAADTIILLDFNRLTCFLRLFKRRTKKDRLDIIKGCEERVTFELIKWVLWTFPQENRKQILSRLKELGDKKIFILKSNKEIEAFLASANR
jgi:adenylate kinase family enzyme